MNILFVSHSNNFGGSEVSLRELIINLSDLGHNIFLSIPFSDSTEYISSLKIPQSNIIFLKPMIWHKSCDRNIFQKIYKYLYLTYKCKGGYIFTVLKLALFIKKNKINIVHTNSIVILDAAIASKICSVPHIQHIREIIGSIDRQFSFPLDKRKSLFCKIMDFLHAHIIFNSRTSLKSAGKLFPKNKSSVIYNSFPDSLYNCSREIRRVKRVGLVANVTSPKKNHMLFLELAKISLDRNYDFTFHIYGKIPDNDNEYFKSLKHYIHTNNLERIVIFEGLKKNISSIYNDIDTLVHTNTNESFGRIYIESMIFNVPIISVNGKATNELITNGINGLIVKNNNAESLFNELLFLSENSAKRTSIVKNAKEYSERFKSSIISKEIINTYLKFAK